MTPLDDDVLARFLHGGQIDPAALLGEHQQRAVDQHKVFEHDGALQPALISSHSPSTRSCSRSMDNGQASAWPYLAPRRLRGLAHLKLESPGPDAVVATDGAPQALMRLANTIHPASWWRAALTGTKVTLLWSPKGVGPPGDSGHGGAHRSGQPASGRSPLPPGRAAVGGAPE